MKAPVQKDRKNEALSAVAPSPMKTRPGRSTTKGEIPSSLLDRYLIERDRQGRPERFYRDHRAADPMFRDEGRRLVTRQTYPDTVADMMKIAQHRGWDQVRVTGDETFRREAWIQGQALGLMVKGYSPRDRDKQAAVHRIPATTSSRDRPAARTARDIDQRMKDAAVVVRRVVPDPAAQARLLERAQSRTQQLRAKDKLRNHASPDRARGRR